MHDTLILRERCLEAQILDLSYRHPLLTRDDIPRHGETQHDSHEQAQRNRGSVRATSGTGWLGSRIGRVSLQGEQVPRFPRQPKQQYRLWGYIGESCRAPRGFESISGEGGYGTSQKHALFF